MQRKLTAKQAEFSLIFTTAIWGSTFLIIKLLVTGDNPLGPFVLLSLRFAMAALTAYLIFRPKEKPGKYELIGGLVIGLAAFLGYTFQTIGLQYTTPAKSGFITSLFVLIIPFVSRTWERVKIPVSVYIALIPAAFGLWAISGAGFSIARINPGDKITLLSAFSYAFQIVGIQIYTQKASWKWLTIFQFAFIAIGSSIALLFTKNPGISFTLGSVSGLIYLAVIASVVALGIQMFAQRFTTSAKASLIYIAEPIFAALFAWIIASQGMSKIEIIGAIAIIVSMIVGRLDRLFARKDLKN